MYDEEKLLKLVDEPPIVRVLNLIISQAINDNAFAIRIEPSETVISVKYKVEGILHEVMTPPAHISEVLAARVKIMAGLDFRDTMNPQNGIINIKYDETAYLLEVESIPGPFGEILELQIKTG
ncbi:MAG: Flp pilus assembly complex ATPase component TadA [Firmicutes bacterium]|nr:Flp pilus assembly complex ATPase component TadA [Bacillota bacterium]